MRILVEFATDNAAFEDNPNEVERILDSAFEFARLYAGADTNAKRIIRDTNGNTVGAVTVES